jgi:cytochrome c peroxidase
MHDGSITTLEEVIDIYARGGRNSKTGEYIGDGKDNIYKHALISGFELSTTEKRALIDFLTSLTDTSYLSNEHYLNPFRNK